MMRYNLLCSKRFTLLEALLAGSLGLIAVTLSISTITYGLNFWKKEQSSFASWHQARMLISSLNRDLRNTDPFQSHIGTEDSLSFIVCNTRLPNQGPLLEVEYARLPVDAPPSQQVITRRVRNLQGDVLKQRSFQTVDALTFSYLSPERRDLLENWLPQWTREASSPPLAVKVVISINAVSNEKAKHLLSTVIGIPTGNLK